VLLQFARGRRGPLLNPEPPSATPVEVYAGDPFVSRLHHTEFILTVSVSYVVLGFISFFWFVSKIILRNF